MAQVFDPFTDARTNGVCEAELDGEVMLIVLSYKDVRLTAGNWQAFSSDTPGRVPIPAEDGVRSLRQLPIETDPPQHDAYRALVKDWFRRPATDEGLRCDLRALVDQRITLAETGQPVDVLNQIALPVQSHALALLLGLPATEAEAWTGWGVHAFKSEKGSDPARADALLRCLEAYVDHAMGVDDGSLFAHLARLDFEGRRLSRDELLGFAHVIFAGGRDTVINSICAIFARLAAHPEEVQMLRAAPDKLPLFVEEIVRFYAPLPMIGRSCKGDQNLAGLQRKHGDRVALCWASANFDAARFRDADRFLPDRSPNPHVGFGSGPHNCLGSTHARELLRLVTARIVAAAGNWHSLSCVMGRKTIGPFVKAHGFDTLTLAFKTGQGN